MTRRPLSAAEFGQLLDGVEHTAFRLELQPAYREPSEADSVAAFVAGKPTDPFGMDGAREWYDAVSRIVRNGGRVERVRVHDDPPTDYQRWLRWLDERFNAPAGELIRYLFREQAHDIGLLPDAAGADWWLLDSHQLIQMKFDHTGRRTHTELASDPAAVVQANKWRDLAVHHSAPLRCLTA